MKSWTFTCPGCGSRLRLREEQLAGRVLDCPDCSVPLVIRRNPQDEWEAERVEGLETEDTLEPSATQPLANPTDDQSKKGFNPTRVSWTVALVAAGVAAFFLLPPQPAEVDTTDSGNETLVPQIVDHEPTETPAASTSNLDGSDSSNTAIDDQPGTEVVTAGWPVVADSEKAPDVPSRPTSDATQELIGSDGLEFDAPHGDDRDQTALGQPSPLRWLGVTVARLWNEPLLDEETSLALNRARLATQEPETPPVDIPERLAQQLLLFEQREPSPLSQQLVQLEELLGVPIVIAESHREQLAPLLETPVTYSLKDCQVEEVLELLLSKIGCVYEVGDESIEIRPAGT